MTVPVIEEVAVRERWRSRRIRSWTASVGAVCGTVGGLSAVAWQHPVLANPLEWLAAAFVVGSGAFIYRAWRRLSDVPASEPTYWHDELPTSRGETPGWKLRRPAWLGKKDRLTVNAMQALFLVPTGVGLVAAGEWELAMMAGVFASPAVVSLTRRLARLPDGIALTREGVHTHRGLLPWQAIEDVTVRSRWNLASVVLTTPDRRLVLDGGDYAMKAEDLAELIRAHRDDPVRRAALGSAPAATGGVE